MLFPLVDDPFLDDDPARDAHETAFLAAIVADPDDDASRLVFADWLEEQSKHDKAAFVRREIEFARAPQSSPDFDRLRRELDRLDDAIGGRWAWALVRPGRLLNCGQADGRHPVVRFAFQCPMRWADLAPRADGVRYCATCDKTVHLCATTDDVEAHAVRGDCVAIPSRLALDVRVEYEQAGPPAPRPDPGDDFLVGDVGPHELPLLPPSPYELWAEDLFARPRKKPWWQFWK